MPFPVCLFPPPSPRTVLPRYSSDFKTSENVTNPRAGSFASWKKLKETSHPFSPSVVVYRSVSVTFTQHLKTDGQ